MKITEGCIFPATLNSARMCFSESPTHLETKEDAEMLKNVALHSLATALANMVLPLPGGPKSSTPRGGRRTPEKSTGFRTGATTISQKRPGGIEDQSCGFVMCFHVFICLNVFSCFVFPFLLCSVHCVVYLTFMFFHPPLWVKKH